MTLVNGPSTYVSAHLPNSTTYHASSTSHTHNTSTPSQAAWRVHNATSTYGEFCAITATPLRYACNVTYLGAHGSGGGPEQYYTTALETATNTYGAENRTFVAVAAEITEGPTLASDPTAAPGEYSEEGEGEAGEAVESSSSEGGGSAKVVRSVPVVLLFAGVLAMYLNI
jgi:hypothetical protein